VYVVYREPAGRQDSIRILIGDVDDHQRSGRAISTFRRAPTPGMGRVQRMSLEDCPNKVTAGSIVRSASDDDVNPILL
jgi:hypothetical protein